MEGPLRILHVVVNMNRGGAETLIMNLYRNIDKGKVQFDFLTCKAGIFDEEIINMGGKVYQIPYITEIGPTSFVREIQNFLTLHPNYQVVHSHLDKMSGLVLRAAKKANVPIRIAHSHNTESEGGVLAKLFKWYAGSHIKSSATHLFACSQAAATWMFRKDAKQAHIFKNGIEAEKFSFSVPIRKKVKASLGIHQDAFVLGHIGRFSRQKNHLFLLDVFAKVHQKRPNTVLVLAGDGPLRREIKEKVQMLNLKDHVKILGVRRDVPALLQAFDVFVFPSFHEGLPVTLIEAQAAGLPCVISNQITAEVDMEVGLITDLSIIDDSIWEGCILNIYETGRVRTTHTDALAKKGYDIREIAKEAEISYLSLRDEAI